MKQGEMLLRAFEDAAKQWGWEEDQGYDARQTSRVLARHRKLKKELLKYIQSLEDSVDSLDKLLLERDAVIKDLRAQMAPPPRM